MIEFLDIYWAGTDKLITAPIFLLFIFLVIYRYVRVKKTIIAIAHSETVKKIFRNFSLRRYLLKAICLVASLVFLFIALLQPQWGNNEELVDQEGRDLFIMLDISRSMLAQDVKPNRLEFAKLKIRRLLELLKTDRVGLVLFSSSAIIQCPLTSDHQAFNAYLQEINEQVIGRGSTTIDVALIKVIELFKKMGREKNKLAFLITDGEDFSTNLNAAQQRALKEDIHLFAMGVGTTEGAPVPKLDDQGRYIGHEVDATGAIALSALNEVKLQSLCTLLHGTYVKASYQDNDIIKIADRVLEFEKEKYSEQKVSLYDDQYPWPLALTTLFLALEWIL